MMSIVPVFLRRKQYTNVHQVRATRQRGAGKAKREETGRAAAEEQGDEGSCTHRSSLKQHVSAGFQASTFFSSGAMGASIDW